MSLSLAAENAKLRGFYMWSACTQLLRENKCGIGTKKNAGKTNPLGFKLEVKRSGIDSTGLGLFVCEGRAKRGEILAVYPGTVFHPGGPLFFFGLKNSYLLRRSDGFTIDGRPRGISRMAYRSLRNREVDQISGYFPSDESWVEVETFRELLLQKQDSRRFSSTALFNAGHYVNHQPYGKNNSNYQEKHFCVKDFSFWIVKEHGKFTVTDTIDDATAPEESVFRCDLPYTFFSTTYANTYGNDSGSSTAEELTIPGVVLVATRDVEEGEEISSCYEEITPESERQWGSLT